MGRKICNISAAGRSKERRMKNMGIQFWFWLLAFAPMFVRAGGEEVVVIYNTRLAASKLVAEHYAELRHVPKAQIYGFDLPLTEEMTRAEFCDQLQFRLASNLEV